ncbi:MAG: hypothetical protein RL682_1958 [Pseudomonadota bacterium]|jgi:hypothetical protein
MGAKAQQTRTKHGKMTALFQSKSLMPKARKHAADLSSNPNDLEAVFYDALQAEDLERLMACWADDEDIVCIHPSGSRIVDTAAIRAAFEAMFSEGGTINAHPEYITPGKCYGQPRNARCSIRRAAARAGTAFMQNRPPTAVYIA